MRTLAGYERTAPVPAARRPGYGAGRRAAQRLWRIAAAADDRERIPDRLVPAGLGRDAAANHNPPADFTAVNQAAFTNLSVRQASVTAGTVKTNGPAASAPITERLTLAGLGTITLSSQLHLVQHDGKWLVQWSPATIAPQLRTGDQLSLRTTWPAAQPSSARPAPRSPPRARW